MTSRPKRCSCEQFRAQELCESRGGRPGLPVLTISVEICGRKSSLKKKSSGQSTGAV